MSRKAFLLQGAAAKGNTPLARHLFLCCCLDYTDLTGLMLALLFRTAYFTILDGATASPMASFLFLWWTGNGCFQASSLAYEGPDFLFDACLPACISTIEVKRRVPLLKSQLYLTSWREWWRNRENQHHRNVQCFEFCPVSELLNGSRYKIMHLDSGFWF